MKKLLQKWLGVDELKSKLDKLDTQIFEMHKFNYEMITKVLENDKKAFGWQLQKKDINEQRECEKNGEKIQKIIKILN